MVPKQENDGKIVENRFRAVLFRMVPKLGVHVADKAKGFRAVLFRMVPKLSVFKSVKNLGFRAVLFRMVPKLV